MATYFHSVLNRIGGPKAEFLDSRKWGRYWAEHWVVYADLLGFADLSPSRDSTVNVIVRFHKCIELARQETMPVRVYQFTDACYALCQDLGRALSTAIAIQHYCLAMNEWRMRRDPLPRFHELLVPRITVARGDVLSVGATESLPDDPSELVRRDNLVAGQGIVNAYRLEKSCAGPQIALSLDAMSEVRKLSVRGDTGAVKTALRHWVDQPVAGRKYGKPITLKAVTLPWPLVRIKPSALTSLWADTRASVESKLRTMLVTWRSNFHQFIVQQGDPAVMKHYAGAMQLVEYCLRSISGIKGRRPHDPAQVQRRLFKTAPMPGGE